MTYEIYRPRLPKTVPGQLSFLVRTASSDRAAIEDVCVQNHYQKLGIKIQRCSRWLDLGANVGAFSVLAGALGAECLGFEAEAANARLAQANLRRNGFPGAVRHAAIVRDSFRGDHVRLFSCPEPGSWWRHSIANQRQKAVPVVVPAIRFSALSELGFDCLKMDIEGAEHAILHDRPNLGWLRMLALEWHFENDPRIGTLKRAMEYLAKWFSRVRGWHSPTHGMWQKETCDFFPAAEYVYASR